MTEPRKSAIGVPAYILGSQESVREAGLCGELSDDHQEMCVRDAGHEPPHGDGGPAWSSPKQTLAEAARVVAAWPYHGMAAQQPGYLDFQAALDRLRTALDA